MVERTHLETLYFSMCLADCSDGWWLTSEEPLEQLFRVFLQSDFTDDNLDIFGKSIV